MILYYAMGGGLGHLTRARALVHTLGLRDRVAVLTASRFAVDPRVMGDFESVGVPRELEKDFGGYRAWLRATIDRFEPAQIYIDTFPGGILGELCHFELKTISEIHHVARLLRWQEYSRPLRGELPRFDRTYIVEPLTEEHLRLIEKHSSEVFSLTLDDPPASSNGQTHPTLRELSRRPLWLVVHSGSEAEVVELLEYADELRKAEGKDVSLVLISPVSPECPYGSVRHADVYPASDLFPLADRIITGCGFNAMRQTERFADRHSFIPFPRRFDDQFLRASRRRNTARL